MANYVIDGVLLLALLLTSLRVGTMYRELKRLRTYQRQYVEIFDETSRAADGIGAAVRSLGAEGQRTLQLLEARIAEARGLVAALERPAAAERPAAPSDDFGSYSPKSPMQRLERAFDVATFKNEILKITQDNRWRDFDGEGETAEPELQIQPPGRQLRMAPSVRTLRRAGGNG